MNDRGEVALKIFCALLSRNDVGVTMYPRLGEQQVKVSFELADTFLHVAKKCDGNHPMPQCEDPECWQC